MDRQSRANDMCEAKKYMQQMIHNAIFPFGIAACEKVRGIREFVEEYTGVAPEWTFEQWVMREKKWEEVLDGYDQIVPREIRKNSHEDVFVVKEKNELSLFGVKEKEEKKRMRKGQRKRR